MILHFFSFSIASGAMYVRRFYDENIQKVAINLAKEIHEEFIETLKRAPWMDDESREASIGKANAMKFHIGYPQELANDTLIDEYYKDMELQATDSYLLSMLRIQRFLKDREIIKLRKQVNKSDWIEHSTYLTEVNAFYSVFENSIRTLVNVFLYYFFVQFFRSR